MKGGIMKNTNIKKTLSLKRSFLDDQSVTTKSKHFDIVFTVLLASILLVSAFAGALEVGDVFSTGTAVSGAASVAGSISVADALETEVEIENEFETSTKNTVSKGQGWIVTGGKGALLEILFVSKEGTTSDGSVDSVSRGWLRAGNLKLKLESTVSTSTSKVFAVTAGDGSVRGILALTKTSQAYQEGFAVWNGDLKLILKNGESFDSKVTLAIEEKQSSGKGVSNRGSGNGGGVNSATTGILELGGNSFTLVGESNKPQKLEFKLKSSSGAVGELKLESGDLKTYTGKIEIEGGSDSEEIKGKVSATLNREGNTLYGPIRVELDGSSATDLAVLEGTIKIALSSEKAKISKDDSIDSDDSDDSEDSNDDSKNEKSISKDKGFWKKFKSFFGN